MVVVPCLTAAPDPPRVGDSNADIVTRDYAPNRVATYLCASSNPKRTVPGPLRT